MDFDEYETLPTNNVTTNMMAGAVAGVMEHCVMYPIDSVKTRMQNLSPNSNAAYRGIGETLLRMVKYEGVLRPVRGMSAMVVGAGPAHALYFSCYEYLKETMQTKTASQNPLIFGAAGMMATVLHDGVMNPAEVVKQRLQMYNSPYKSCLHCALKVYRTEGVRAFYRSYTTQLTMNIPFQSIHFMTYEFFLKLTNREKRYNPPAHMISGAIAGAVAAAATTPLDVCKTFLNTNTLGRTSGMIYALQMVYKLGGSAAYFRGLQARVLYQMPATAICWSTYEFFKYFITVNRMSSEAGEVNSSLRLVVPQATISAGSFSDHDKLSSFGGRINEDVRLVSSQGSGSDPWVSSPGPTKLPAVSGAGLYGALTFNTVHTGDSSIHQANSLLGVSPR